jgi:hypothetical protein
MTPDLSSDGSPIQWWFNAKTGEVEQGLKSKSLDRIGPFNSKAEAERALDVIRARSEQWLADETED